MLTESGRRLEAVGGGKMGGSTDTAAAAAATTAAESLARVLNVLVITRVCAV